MTSIVANHCLNLLGHAIYTLLNLLHCNCIPFFHHSLFDLINPLWAWFASLQSILENTPDILNEIEIREGRWPVQSLNRMIYLPFFDNLGIVSWSVVIHEENRLGSLLLKEGKNH